MLKRSLIWLVILAGLTLPVQAAGTLPGFSLTPQFDQNGKPAPGCLLYTIQAGTTSTPQNSYQDSNLSILMPNPISCDASSRLPQFFLADGLIKVRLTTSSGTQIFVQDNLLVIGPSSGGGGGGGSVDPTTILQTGAVQAYYGTGTRSGYVRLNGRTIGSATSGATERANSDAQQLFEYLWNTDSTLTVSGGRGVSANADWLANKTLTLPDARNRVFAGLGDMGNSDAGLFAGLSFSKGDGVTLGSILAGTVTLATENLPPYTPSGSLSAARWSGPTGRTKFAVTTVGGAGYSGESVFWTGSQDIDLSVQSTFTGTAQGGTSTPVKVAQPTILMTIYIKL
ncbi:MAG: hypothetical protein QG616_1906 [Pseudomonadota bacterium]|nr:hypothetical protein [Pseudomonadota bacterium]